MKQNLGILTSNSATKPRLRLYPNRWATYKNPAAQTAHLVFADTKANTEKTKRAVFCQRLEMKFKKRKNIKI